MSVPSDEPSIIREFYPELECTIKRFMEGFLYPLEYFNLWPYLGMDLIGPSELEAWSWTNCYSTIDYAQQILC
jgi:hypothetical protein